MTRRAAKKHNPEWLEQQVNVPREKCGLLMIAKNDEELETIRDYQAKALANYEDVRIIDRHELFRLEPELEITSDVKAALYSPEEYVVDPFLLPLSNLYVALHYGCTLVTSCSVKRINEDPTKGMWRILAETR